MFPLPLQALRYVTKQSFKLSYRRFTAAAKFPWMELNFLGGRDKLVRYLEQQWMNPELFSFFINHQ